MVTEGKNNRRITRYQVEMRVRISPDSDKDKSFWFGQANDISEFGMSLFVPTEFAVGTVIRIEFKLPYSSQPLLLRGTIRNRSSFRYGVEFVYPSPSDRKNIVRTCTMMTALD